MPSGPHLPGFRENLESGHVYQHVVASYLRERGLLAYVERSRCREEHEDSDLWKGESDVWVCLPRAYRRTLKIEVKSRGPGKANDFWFTGPEDYPPRFPDILAYGTIKGDPGIPTVIIHQQTLGMACLDCDGSDWKKTKIYDGRPGRGYWYEVYLAPRKHLISFDNFVESIRARLEK